jgi:23S rRNA (pseudouridine1915-N3)-methyltransferase
MKLVVMAAGKLRERYAQLGSELYALRLRAMVPFEIVEVAEPRGSDAEQTGKRLSSHLREYDRVILLASDGTQHSSEQIASLLSETQKEGRGRMVFVVGGPYGAGKAVDERASLRLSFGPVTLPHELARVVLLEQLYRAMTILRGHSYHHGDGP